jgi:predicted RNA-binding protein with RPS1 domain
MSEEPTNVADDEIETPVAPATDPTATATSAEVDTTTADAASEDVADTETTPVDDTTPADDTVTESAATEETAEPVADTTPTDGDESADAATAATAEGETDASQERPRRRDRDGKRGERGGGRNANKRKLDTIAIGEELQGVVRSLQTYGAFVDVGAERDGLVHISELRDGFVEKVEDVVKEGDTVAVRVKEVDVTKGRLSLTMRPPRAPREERAPREPRAAGEAGGDGADRPRRERREGVPGERREGGERPPRREAEVDNNKTKLRDLVEGTTMTGKVTSIVDYGAFVDIGAQTDGLVHISEIQDERVNKVSDVLSEGQEVQVRILGVDKKRNRVSLSMKPASEAVDMSYQQYNDEDEGGEPASPMRDAFDRAREKKRRDKRGGERGGRKNNRYDDDVDDIISRTLRWRD